MLTFKRFDETLYGKDGKNPPATKVVHVFNYGLYEGRIYKNQGDREWSLSPSLQKDGFVGGKKLSKIKRELEKFMD